MSRMLEALRQIETQPPETRPTVRPVSPEEFDSFGLRRSPGSEAQEPPQAEQAASAAEAIEPAESAAPGEPDAQVESTDAEQATPPSEPDQVESSAERAEAPVAEGAVSDTAPEAAPVRESDRNVRRLLSPLADEHQQPYRELAGNILGQLSPGRPAVLMFTSPGDGEGKTSMLAALAVALAEEVAEDVVVVDANFRNPALANDFGIWADQGLVEVLTGEMDWRQVVRKTSAKHLSVLPGGRFPGDEGPLPEDLKLASLLETLRRGHRLVLVDTASLQYPEVAPLSGMCDGTYLVVALGETERNAARQAVRLIERCGGQLLGCVLTNAATGS
jgi:Mrp family chromosome partitioning ATPase